MTLATAVKAAFTSPSSITKLEARSGEAQAALVAAGESQVAFQRALHEAEKSGDIPAANKAAQKLSELDTDVARLRVRRSAIASALTEARSEQGTAEASDRLETLRAALAAASKDADAAGHAAVVSMLSLGAALRAYNVAASKERDARAGIEGGGIMMGVRNLGALERQATLAAKVVGTIAVQIPAA